MMRKLLLMSFVLALTALAAEQMYVLGPDDQLIVQALDVKEFDGKPVRVDERGMINLPMIGRIEAGGKTIEQLEAELRSALKKYLHEPDVTVSVAEFRPRPVSIFGAVARPGVMQLRGPKSLWEALTEAGGFKNEVGDKIRITRRLSEGEIPLPEARVDETGKFSIVELDTESVMEMTNPDENILLNAHDVISVSTADVVYVVGHVNRAGGFVTNGSISLLEALSLSGGFKEHAKAKDARILREIPNSDERQIIAVNLKRVLSGQDEDISLKPQDILFVPHNAWKDFGIKMMMAATGAATSAAIYSGIRGY